MQKNKTEDLGRKSSNFFLEDFKIAEVLADDDPEVYDTYTQLLRNGEQVQEIRDFWTNMNWLKENEIFKSIGK